MHAKKLLVAHCSFMLFLGLGLIGRVMSAETRYMLKQDLGRMCSVWREYKYNLMNDERLS